MGYELWTWHLTGARVSGYGNGGHRCGVWAVASQVVDMGEMSFWFTTDTATVTHLSSITLASPLKKPVSMTGMVVGAGTVMVMG